MADTTDAQQGGGKHRVALELLEKIAKMEADPRPGDERKYFLSLYRQCYDVVARNATYVQAVGTK